MCAFIELYQILQDRLEKADIFKQYVKSSCPVYADSLENLASRYYGAQPERLIVIQDGTTLFLSGVSPMFYNVGELKAFLHRVLRKSS